MFVRYRPAGHSLTTTAFTVCWFFVVVCVCARKCLGALRPLERADAPRKLVVHAAIARKADAASLTMSSACLWDAAAGDRSVCARWENPHLHCIVTVYALHL